ncbi:Vgb family protein [Longivirga aurantiaca]|uniref:PQQ-binding-like beta-propeller repeat protein n=1 Tax=Longivirga aurantiaca TaxID=1837743 RepID=A0ABW1SXS7_9ACTN
MRSLRWTVPVAAAGLLLAGCASGPSAPAESSTSAAASSPGPLLLGPVGLADVDGTAWVAWSASGVVTSIDADGVPGEPVPVGDTPLRMAVLDGSLWVTTIADGRLTEVDPATGTVGRSVDIGDEPEGVVAFDGHLFVVLQKEAALVEVDPASGEVVARYDVGGAPRLVTGGLGSLFVTDFEGGRIVRVTPRTGKVTASKVACPGAQDVAYVDGTVYASCMDDDVVLGLDPDSLAEVARFAVPGDPDGLAAGVAGSLLVGLQEGPGAVYVDLGSGAVSPLFDADAGGLRDRSNVDVLQLAGSALVSDALADAVVVLSVEGAG